MKKVTVAIGLNKTKVGDLYFETDGVRQSSTFRYAPEWIDHPQSFALSPAMPISSVPYYASGDRKKRQGALLGPFTDASPDSWGRGIITKAVGGRPSELEFLLLSDDHTRIGALRFLDEEGNALANTEPPIPRLNDLQEIRQLAHIYESDPSVEKVELDAIMGYVGSLGGARPKSNFDDEGILSIAKFTSEFDTRPIERAEVATLNLAQSLGLSASNARIELGKSHYPVAIIERFDRRDTARIPFISAQTFLGLPEASGHYYTDIADQMFLHAIEPQKQVAELYRRMMFGILVGNTDCHLKNEGFLYAGQGKWALAPAFDINPQPERHPHLETGIYELSGFEASIEAALEAAPYFEIKGEVAKKFLSELINGIDREWKTHCKQAGMSGKEIKSYEPAFDSAQSKIARKLTTERVSIRSFKPR
ncbi:type II toxin-antitoxin system HipA family toxin [Pseudovibrio ascidiaceicola]|uniref:type II toxin-antitoxin system HipA family toxin n=1 Tax=Pseudovibrio ascidiaceicola TaxID=285279 RepID=UPI003D3671E0